MKSCSFPTLAAVALLSLVPVAHAEANVSSVSVVRLQPQLDQMVRTFQTRGTSAVANDLRLSLRDQQTLAAWQEFAREGQAKLTIEIHKNETLAIENLQNRFKRMGLPELKVEGVVTEGRPDPRTINNDEVFWHKWIRYGAGPGITLAASYFNMPAATTGTFSDYMFILAPTAAAGVATIVLELIFAKPWMNDNVWKPFFSGPIRGRRNNILVNFAIGLGLWGAQVGGAHLPELFGAGVVPVHLIGFKQAAIEALWGAVLFNMFFGQYQTDLVNAEESGSITASQRYKLETTGGVLVGGGRVAYWTLPHGVAYLGLMAEIGFAMMKTLPLALKSYFADPMRDRQVARLIQGEEANPPTKFETCGRILSEFGLVNLPTTEKNVSSPAPASAARSESPAIEPAAAAM